MTGAIPQRRKILCRVPGCPRGRLARVNDTQLGPIEDIEVLCPDHWKLIPLRHRRVYRRARQAFFTHSTRQNHARCNRLWSWLVRYAIERSVGL